MIGVKTGLNAIFALDIFCLVLMIGLYATTAYITKGSKNRVSPLIVVIISFYGLLMITNDIWLVGEISGKMSVDVMYALNSLYFVAVAVTSALWLVHVLPEMKMLPKEPKPFTALILIPAAAMVVLALTAKQNGLVFYFNETGNYTRGPLYMGFSAIGYAYLVVAAVVSAIKIGSKDIHMRHKAVVMATVSAFVIVFGVIQVITGCEYAVVGFASGMVIYFAYLILLSTREHLDEVSAVSEKLENYQHAILAESLISLEIDLTDNLLTYGEWKSDKGENVPLKDILGIELPCSYDTYIDMWNKRFVEAKSGQSFSENTRRENLIKSFENGKREITFDYEARTISGDQRYLRRSIAMVRNATDDHVIAYTNVKDISDIGRIKEQREAFINALAADSECIDIVEIGEEKGEDYLVGKFSLSEQFRKLMPEEWLNETHISKRISILSELVVPEDRERFIRSTRREVLIKSFEKNQVHVVDFRLQTEEGEAFYQERFVPTHNVLGGVNGMLICIRCTDGEIRKEMAYRAELEKAKAAAESASSAKTTFLFNMSHDIRTPMNAILGFTRIASNHLDDREQTADCLKKIEYSGEQLLDLINDVLEMSRIESGKIDVIEEPANLNLALENLNPMLSSLALTKSIEYTWDIHDIADPFVRVDSVHLNRVLVNLINNAIKYTPDGGKVHVDITQTAPETDGRATYSFTVSDTGIGMSEEFVEHMFEEFSREKSSTVSKQQGTGLGLAIAKRITDTLGGTITASSKLGEGSTFVLTLPLGVMTDEEVGLHFASAAVNRESISGIKADIRLKDKKVLLVEDNELNREIAIDILEEEGMFIDSAEDGQIAVNIIGEKGIGYYDFILMDVQMPVMDGYEATRRIRAMQKEGEHVTIIAVSANAFEEDKRHSAEAGMDDHIAKPVNIDELEAVLKKFAE